jgi:futalosine hydrolase
MSILLCAATAFEIQPTIDWLQKRSGHAVEILITGVGLVPATYALTKAVVSNPWDLVLQAGIAGTLHHSINLGEVVQVKTDTIGETGVIENGTFQSLFKMQLIGPDEKPWQQQKLVNPYDELFLDTLPVVDSVSINEITTDANRINYYLQSLGATVESMEGAALHYVCLMESVPFLQLRSISNHVGERNKAKWNLTGAVSNLNLQLQNFLSNRI